MTSELNLTNYNMIIGDLNTNTYKGINRMLKEEFAYDYFEPDLAPLVACN